VATSAKEQLISEIRSKIKDEGYDYSKHEKLQEQIYIPLKNENWEGITEAMAEVEEEFGVDLTEQKQYLEQIIEPDMLEGVDEPEIDKDASTREKLLIKRQVTNSENDEILARTDEEISVDNLFQLQESIYEESGKKCFIISEQHEWEGRVSVELSNTKKKFELMAVYESSEGSRKYKHFGQSNPNKGLKKTDEFNKSFYQYKFVADD